MSDSSKAIFLSYASQDAEAAKRICDALRAAGVEVWFDQSELRGGDAWDSQIRRQIKECALFVPVVSQHTQERLEGYFRLEWHLAERRMQHMHEDAPFLLPVTIDGTKDENAKVPARFLEVQWTKLPAGETTPAFCARVRKLLAGEGDAGRDRLISPSPRERGDDRGGIGRFDPFDQLRAGRLTAGDPAPKRRHRRWLAPVIGGAAVAVLALVLARPWQKIAAPPPVAEPAKAAPAAAPDVLSPARQLAERAWTILNQGSLTRAQLDAAGELCDRALQLDSTDAVVWARAAAADLELIYPYGYDRSDERRRRAQERAARATSLGSDLFEVRVVQAMVFAHAVGTPALLAEAEKTFRDLIPRHPDDKKLVIQLAEVLREQKRYEEAAKMFESIAEFEVAGWSYYEGGQLRAALAAVSRSRRSVTGLQLKAILQLEADEDLAAAQKTVDQLQPSELLAEMPAAIAIRVALYRRDPQRMLELAQGLAQDYLESNAFHGPRRYYTGLAHELAGRNSQAEGEWRSALAVVEARLRSAPENRELLLWSAWLHAALNDAAEAERLFAHSQAIAGLSGDTMDEKNVLVLLRLKRREPLLAWGDRVMQTKPPGWEFAHAEMRFSPLSDFLRGDPHFEKLLRDNLPAGAKPFEDQVSAVSDQRSVSDPKAKTPSPGPLRPPEVDAKSVAVLAFANLSDDKANE